MQTGKRVDFYYYRGKYLKQETGTLIAFNEFECEILPDGKTKVIRVPTSQVMQ